VMVATPASWSNRMVWYDMDSPLKINLLPKGWKPVLLN
jgi:hypothetical protein